MQFLIWNIIFSSFFILCIKWSQNDKRTDVVTVGAINYIVAAIWSVHAYWYSTPSDQVVHAVWTGATMGTCYFVAFFFLIYAVHWIGASNSAAVSRLSLVIPVSAGILFWHEYPNVYQSIGIAIAFVSLFLVGQRPRTGLAAEKPIDHGVTEQDLRSEQIVIRSSTESRSILIWFVLLTFFLICGCSRLTQQTCNQLCDPEQDYPTFLFSAFVAAGIPSLAVLVFRQMKISMLELLVGLVLGVSNILQSHFILLSLDSFPGNSAFVFTLTSTGGLVFTTGVAVLLMKEKVSRQSAIGIALASASILLLQMSTTS